jgi:hypothetical protein
MSWRLKVIYLLVGMLIEFLTSPNAFNEMKFSVFYH